MRYPTFTSSKTDELVARLVAGDRPSFAADISWVGRGDDVDLSGLDATVDALKARYLEFQASSAGSTEEFEGIAAGDLHRALRDLPVDVLDDPGFWRYVSLAKLWWFIEDRESGPIARGNHLRYVDGGHPTECVPLRMFLRAQAVRDGDDYSLASSMKNATDFWRSHVIRVQTGTAPALARSFAKLQVQERMATTPELRPFARRVNRLWSNIVLNRLDEPETDALMRELYETRRVDDGAPADDA